MITLATFLKKILKFISNHPSLILGLLVLGFMLTVINSCGGPSKKTEITRMEEKQTIKAEKTKDKKIQEKKNKKIKKHKVTTKPDGTKVEEHITIEDQGQTNIEVATKENLDVQQEKKSEHVVIEEKGKPQHLVGGAVTISPSNPTKTIKPGDVSGFIGQRLFDSDVFLTIGTTGKLDSIQLGVIVEF